MGMMLQMSILEVRSTEMNKNKFACVLQMLVEPWVPGLFAFKIVISFVVPDFSALLSTTLQNE